MKVIGLYSVLLLTCIGQIQCGFRETVPLNKTSIQVLQVYPCDKHALNTVISTLRILNDDFDKGLDLDIDLDEPVTKEFWAFVKIEEWKNGAWTDFLTINGNLCELMRTYCKDAWQKLGEAVKPPVKQPCEWPAGSYEARGFTVTPHDFDVPVSEYGRGKGRIEVYDTDGDLFLCHMIEFEVDRIS